jgi:hypothetical protein
MEAQLVALRKLVVAHEVKLATGCPAQAERDRVVQLRDAILVSVRQTLLRGEDAVVANECSIRMLSLVRRLAIDTRTELIEPSPLAHAVCDELDLPPQPCLQPVGLPSGLEQLVLPPRREVPRRSPRSILHESDAPSRADDTDASVMAILMVNGWSPVRPCLPAHQPPAGADDCWLDLEPLCVDEPSEEVLDQTGEDGGDYECGEGPEADRDCVASLPKYEKSGLSSTHSSPLDSTFSTVLRPPAATRDIALSPIDLPRLLAAQHADCICPPLCGRDSLDLSRQAADGDDSDIVPSGAAEEDEGEAEDTDERDSLLLGALGREEVDLLDLAGPPMERQLCASGWSIAAWAQAGGPRPPESFSKLAPGRGDATERDSPQLQLLVQLPSPYAPAARLHLASFSPPALPDAGKAALLLQTRPLPPSRELSAARCLDGTHSGVSSAGSVCGRPDAGLTRRLKPAYSVAESLGVARDRASAWLAESRAARAAAEAADPARRRAEAMASQRETARLRAAAWKKLDDAHRADIVAAADVGAGIRFDCQRAVREPSVGAGMGHDAPSYDVVEGRRRAAARVKRAREERTAAAAAQSFELEQARTAAFRVRDRRIAMFLARSGVAQGAGTSAAPVAGPAELHDSVEVRAHEDAAASSPAASPARDASLRLLIGAVDDDADADDITESQLLPPDVPQDAPTAERREAASSWHIAVYASPEREGSTAPRLGAAGAGEDVLRPRAQDGRPGPRPSAGGDAAARCCSGLSSNEAGAGLLVAL